MSYVIVVLTLLSNLMNGTVTPFILKCSITTLSPNVATFTFPVTHLPTAVFYWNGTRERFESKANAACSVYNGLCFVNIYQML